MQIQIHEMKEAPASSFLAEESNVALLTIPGLGNSGPRHWQTHWERLAYCRRAELGDWERARLDGWVPALDRAIREHPRPIVLVAHSLGCIAAVWWARMCWSEAFRENVRGALLVAPADVDAPHADPRIRDFRPLPASALPFRSIVVASRDDPYASFGRSRAMAEAWGSELVDLGKAGHINADSGLHEWPRGLRLAAELGGQNANLLVAELGLRSALA
jgi:predicted alpha/beta hydrolase family esterase